MNALKHICKWLITAAMLLLLPAALVSAQERPLAEVVKEKPAGKASRVYTDEDLRPEPERVSNSAVRPPIKPETPVAEEAAGSITVPGLLENGRASEARSILESVQRDEQVLLRRYAEIEKKLATETDPHLRRLYSGSLSRREETLTRKRKQIEEVRKAMEAAENDRSPASRSEHEAKQK
ncbi:MAG TPA: hypothetical protein VKT29_18130 [Terriglobales bacterium]|nr:hypothetical protein [Terriglobales bacterium]